MSSGNGSASDALRLFERFTGLARAHGYWRPDGTTRADGKVGGFASTPKTPATIETWEGHLQGVYGLGIIPIRDDATVRWGAIDIDADKHPNMVEIAKHVHQLELPLITCRSKSGGVHLYLFMSEDATAAQVRGKLMEWAIALGYSGVEVFPKQTRLAGPRDFGNYINMPYFGGDTTTTRYAVNDKGERIGLSDFLALADVFALTVSELADMGTPSNVTFGDALVEAPPCLQCIAGKGGAGEGNRNKMLFNIGVYLRKRHEDAWEQYFDEYNRAPFVDAPLPSKEMQGLVKSVNRKAYEYTCNDSPIAQVCSRQICLTRKFGIGQGDNDPGVVFGTLGKLTTTPPMWLWDVDGERLELTTDELKDQTRFHTVCINTLNKWPRLIKPNEWATLIRAKLENVEVIEVPADAKPEGQMWAHLQNYTTGRAKAKTRDELLNDKPWTPNTADADRYGDQVLAGRVYFRSSHFKQYLEQQRMTAVTEKRLWAWLRVRGANHHNFNINGKFINVWSVPAFAEQTEPHLVPRLQTEDM